MFQESGWIGSIDCFGMHLSRNRLKSLHSFKTYMYKYLHYVFSCLAMLFSIFHGMPALAFNGPVNTPGTSWLAQEMRGAQEAPWSYGKSMPFAALDNTEVQSGGGYRWEGPPAEKPDWRGIKWDTGYFLAYQFAAIAILYVMPESISGWDQDAKDNYDLSRWWDNVTNPVWDKDEWYVNYILHPYWGATYYIRARERGFNRVHSFWYSFLLSCLYEFGAEALFEPVSYQDLVVTPVAGSLVGEYMFTPLREWIRSKDQLYWYDKVGLFFTDPLGVINESLNKLLGVNTSVSFRQLRLENTPQVLEVQGETQSSSASGVRARTAPWGLHMKIIW